MSEKLEFCYRCFGKNDRTCYRPKGHKRKHAGMKVAVRAQVLGVPPKEPQHSSIPKEPSKLQKHLRQIGEQHNVDFAMGDPELALLIAYQLGCEDCKKSGVPPKEPAGGK